MCSFALPASAADGTEPIKASEMTVTGEYNDGSGNWIDCTSLLETKTYYNSTVLNGMFSVRFPLTLPDTAIWTYLSTPFSINADHEYNLSFEWGYTQITDKLVLCMSYLNFYNSDGDLIGQQMISSQTGTGNNKIHSVDIDFKPNVTSLDSGYKCRIEIAFAQDSSVTASEVFCISQEINLIDKDDDSGWFQKIINKIEETISNIKQIPEKINQKLTELKESITNAFVELKENLIEGLKGLFVPSDGFFEEKKAELELFLEDHFGILWTAPNIMISTIEQLLTIDIEEPSITMPAIQFTWEDELITLTEPMTVNFNDYIGEGTPLETFYNFYRVFVTIILIFLFIHYCLKKYHYIFGKDGEAVEH